MGTQFDIGQYINFLNNGVNISQKWYNSNTKNRFNLGDTSKSPLNSPYNFDPLGVVKTKNPFALNPTKGSSALGTSKGINFATSGLDLINTFLPSANDDSTTNAINAGYSAMSDVAMSIPGYGQLIGGAMKAKSAMNKGLAAITGGATTIKNPSTTADKILSSDLFGASPLGIVNALTKTKVSGTDKSLANAAQAYGNVNTSSDTEVGGVSKAFSWLTGSKNKAKQKQALTSKYNVENIKKTDIVNESKKNLLAAQNTYQNILEKNNQKLMGGVNTNILSAKNGDKLLFSKIQKNVTKKFEKGGEVNVIPSGALHRELNRLDGDFTNKGIPVIMEEDGGKITQQAEIERNELILNLSLTKKLETLLEEYKKNNNDEILILAGKILTSEILENTIDNTNLLNTV